VTAPVRLNPGGRSPAEKAFDFLMFPSVLNIVLLVASAFFSSFTVQSIAERIPSPNSSLHRSRRASP